MRDGGPVAQERDRTRPGRRIHGERLAGGRGCGRPSGRPADDVAGEQRKRGELLQVRVTRIERQDCDSLPAVVAGSEQRTSRSSRRPGRSMAEDGRRGQRRGRSPAKQRSTSVSNGLVWSVPASAVSPSVPATRPPGTRGGWTSRTLGDGGSPPFRQPTVEDHEIARARVRWSGISPASAVAARCPAPRRRPAPARAARLGWPIRVTTVFAGGPAAGGTETQAALSPATASARSRRRVTCSPATAPSRIGAVPRAGTVTPKRSGFRPATLAVIWSIDGREPRLASVLGSRSRQPCRSRTAPPDQRCPGRCQGVRS